MTKKILVLAIITMMITTAYPALAGQLSSTPSNENPSTNIQIQTLDLENNNGVVSATTIDGLLDSLTIGEIVDLLRQQMNENTRGQVPMAPALLFSLDQGVQSLEQLGIQPTTTLGKLRNLLSTTQSTLKATKYRPFLIGILPIQATVSTILPTIIINLTTIPTMIGNVSVKFEIFTKVVPFVDRIVARQIGLPKMRLTESSIIWPTIGGRITIAGFTIFIVAFGPRIRWTRG